MVYWFRLWDACCHSLCTKDYGAKSYRFIAVGDVKVGRPLKHILLRVPLGGCHWVLHTKAISIWPKLVDVQDRHNSSTTVSLYSHIGWLQKMLTLFSPWMPLSICEWHISFSVHQQTVAYAYSTLLLAVWASMGLAVLDTWLCGACSTGSVVLAVLDIWCLQRWQCGACIVVSRKLLLIQLRHRTSQCTGSV